MTPENRTPTPPEWNNRHEAPGSPAYPGDGSSTPTSHAAADGSTPASRAAADGSTSLPHSYARDNNSTPPTPLPHSYSGGGSSPSVPSEHGADGDSYASFVPAARHAGVVREGRTPGKPASNKKVALIFAGALVAVLVLAYVAVALTFSDRFMPGTTMLGEDVSLKTADEVQDMLVDVAKGYSLVVTGQGLSLTLTSADLGMGVDAERVTDAMLADQNPWAWPVELFGQRDESDKFAVSGGSADQAVRKAVDAFNENAAAPRNAGLDYDDTADKFVIRTETPGEALDVDQVIAQVNAAAATLAPSVELTADVLRKPTLLASDERLIKAEADANALLQANFSLKLGDTPVAQVNADVVSGWLHLQDDASIVLGEDDVAAWVQEIASACNTYQARRSYTRADGKQIDVSGGVYGWIVDKDQLKADVLAGVRAAQTGEATIPCEQEAGAYNGLHGRDWGPRYIDVDLTEQHARFYDESGALIWESDVVTGTPDGEHDTPEGIYVLNAKESPSKLIGQMKPETGEPEYQTEVKTWMPFVQNYIGFHDAEWQPAFGGSRYSTGNGSHGCVNLPPDKSVALYDLVKVGDVVVSHW